MYRTIFSPVFLILVFVATSSGQRLGEQSEEKHLIYKDCPVPYELVILSVKHYVGNIFMLADPGHFNETDLTRLFTCLSRKYPEFALLDITLFSDRANLDVAITEYMSPPPHTEPSIDTSTEDCKNLRRAIHPCPRGYYRADYFRFDGREHYDFSPDPNTELMKRVTLSGRKSP